jgi:hypothetical protein
MKSPTGCPDKWCPTMAIIIISIIVILIGCSSDHDYNLPLGKFEIRNVELYIINDLDCAYSYSSGMNILFYCDTSHMEDDTKISPGSYVMADVWVTDEDFIGRYLNIEIFNPSLVLDWALHNYPLQFTAKPDSEYQVFFIFAIGGNVTGLWMIDVWLESINRTTNVYSIEVNVE